MSTFSRTLAVGDTHGAYKALRQALSRADFSPAQDRLIVLGDTMDGWSEAPQLIDYYMALGVSVVYLLGNHDLAFLEWVENGCRRHLMEGHGGYVTRYVYTNLNTDDIERHCEWLKHQRLTFIDEQNRVYVHAGWDQQWPFEHPEQTIQQHYCWDRSFWQGMFEGRNWGKSFTDVFVGHSPTIRFKPFAALPMTRRNVHNLDTGAAFHGKVTVMDVESKQFWQSDKCQDLYPLERGRN